MGEVYPPLAAPKATRGKGGGGKDGEYSTAFLIPPPLYPLPQGEGKLVFGQPPIPPFLRRGDRRISAAISYSKTANLLLRLHE